MTLKENGMIILDCKKNVIETLRIEGFFENNVAENEESGMLIRITAKGIKETLGAGKRFQALPKVLKELKIATLRYLPEIIKHRSILEDNVENTHKKEDYMFAYIMSNVIIDNEEFRVRISVRKSGIKFILDSSYRLYEKRFCLTRPFPRERIKRETKSLNLL